MRRHVCDDSANELYTRFRYSPVTGLGYEEGVSRRDPSSIIKVGDLYYKGHAIGSTMPADSKWGVAVADHPEGPYRKSPLNPVTNTQTAL